MLKIQAVSVMQCRKNSHFSSEFITTTLGKRFLLVDTGKIFQYKLRCSIIIRLIITINQKIIRHDAIIAHF